MKSCLENPGTPRQTSLVPTSVVLASIITWPVLLIYTQQWQNVILPNVCQKHQLFMLRVPSAQHLPDYNSSSFLTFGLSVFEQNRHWYPGNIQWKTAKLARIWNKSLRAELFSLEGSYCCLELPTGNMERWWKTLLRAEQGKTWKQHTHIEALQ